jgi:hypothetical protein
MDGSHRGAGGVFIVSALILLMNYNHPYTFTGAKGGYIYSYYAAGYRSG